MIPIVDRRLVTPRFTLDDVQRASDEWGLNCGPAAVAAITQMSLEEIRPYLGDFEGKRYTNPTLMWRILRNIGLARVMVATRPKSWPFYGLARVQWEGPWTAPGVPMPVRYRHTHWVGSMRIEGEEENIFDVNCMSVGGWVPLSEWAGSVVPWLLNECEPKASGKWHLTHAVEIELPNAR